MRRETASPEECRECERIRATLSEPEITLWLMMFKTMPREAAVELKALARCRVIAMSGEKRN